MMAKAVRWLSKSTPAGVGLLSAVLALLLGLVIVFGKYGGNPTGLARIGDQLPLSPRLQGQELVVLRGKRGNDGQQFLTLALDPLQSDPGTSAALDNPIYRGKRLLYPLLAWLLGFGQPGLIPWTLSSINVACIGLAAAQLQLFGERLLAFHVEHVAGTLQEQHSEDVLLELRGIHLASQDVRRGEEVAFELGKR